MSDDLNQPNAPDPLAPQGLGAAFDHFKKVVGDAMKVPQSRPKGRILTAPEYNKPVVGKAEPVPTKFCEFCGTITESKIVASDSPLISRTCDRCQGQLDEGAIALMSPDRRFAFVFDAKLGEMGQRHKISNLIMDAVMRRFQEQKEKQDGR